MDTSQIFTVMGFAAPLISGVICLMVMGLFLTRPHTPLERKISLLLVAEFAACVFCWISLLAYVLKPEIYIRIEAPFYLCILYAQVTTYHYLFSLTGTGVKERFNSVHYIIPAVISLTLFVWSFFVPDSVKLYITESRGDFPQGYEPFSFLATSNRYMFMVYNILYSVLGLSRIVHFRKALEEYSADEGHSSVRWLRILMYVALSTVPLSFIPAVLGVNKLVGTLVAFVPTLLIVFKDVILIYNTVSGNYVVIEPGTAAEDSGGEQENSGNRPDRLRFERYMQTQKPYLNPRLRITDITEPLCTNRTYLSGFINQTYGMNFNRYINRLRLQEVADLRLNPACQHLNGLELVQKAGFSNFDAYLRIKDKEDERTTLKLN